MSTPEHWDAVYGGKAAHETSWYRPDAGTSMRLVDEALRVTGAQNGSAVDVGCGTSTVVDELLDRGWRSVTALDVSAEALAVTRARLSARPGPDGQVTVVVADVLDWRPHEPVDLWHDRAVLHFLTDPEDVRAYARLVSDTVSPTGVVVLGTFGPNGPEQCSGLPVRRYDATGLAALLAPDFRLLADETEVHRTPWGSGQEFTWVTLARR